jgi:AcrR family transcriptional regulator
VGRTKTIDDDEILQHARAVFRKDGPAAATRDVARAAGISQAVLYQRFGSKEDMFLRAIAPKPPNIESLLGPYQPADALADLERIARRIAGYLRALMPTLLHVVAHPELGHARLLELHRGLAFQPLVAALISRFERLQGDGLVAGDDPATAARAFLALVHSSVFFEFMSHGKVNGRHTSSSDELLGVLWDGLAPRKRRDAPQKSRGRRKG